MGFKIGVCGAGSFSPCFIPLFQAHPLVDEVVLADLAPDRLKETAEQFGIKRTFGSLDELCESDVDAIAIITQRWMHGPQALKAMRAGKHVWSAVPAGISVDEIKALVEIVEKTGLIYMLAETSYYYPSTLYCRDRYAKGDFGKFVYGEAQYYHDMDHGFYDVFKRSGEGWERTASFPPMYYPSHSVSMIVSVTGAHVTSVSCLGYRDQENDGVFDEKVSMWGNAFSNEVAIMRMSDGGIARINEFRRVGWRGMASVYMSMYGTKGSFEEQANARVWCSQDVKERVDLMPALMCGEKKPNPDEAAKLAEELQKDFYSGMSPVHPVDRLPKEFLGQRNGHFGSHQFLVDDFCKSVATGQQPPNHVWAAARYCLPGIIAHESAKREGQPMEVPDLGWPE
jgi:predicted dehydrogenase